MLARKERITERRTGEQTDRQRKIFDGGSFFVFTNNNSIVCFVIFPLTYIKQALNKEEILSFKDIHDLMIAYMLL
jgi:hypothetical protein